MDRHALIAGVSGIIGRHLAERAEVPVLVIGPCTDTSRGLPMTELVVAVDGTPEPETPVVYGEKEVGRVTSAVGGLALAYVRIEVPDDAELTVGGASARLR